MYFKDGRVNFLEGEIAIILNRYLILSFVIQKSKIPPLRNLSPHISPPIALVVVDH